MFPSPMVARPIAVSVRGYEGGLRVGLAGSLADREFSSALSYPPTVPEPGPGQDITCLNGNHAATCLNGNHAPRCSW